MSDLKNPPSAEDPRASHGTKIEWTHIPGYRGERWNPVTGCAKVSDGCKHCYAETYSKRFWGKRKFTDVQCHEDRLEIPLRWKKPRAIFVNSMSDLFHEDVPFDFIDKVMGIMLARKALLGEDHIFIVLTKRPKRMLTYFNSKSDSMHLKAWAEAVDHLVFINDGEEYFSEYIAAATSDHFDHDGKHIKEYPYWGYTKDLFPLPNLWLGGSPHDHKSAVNMWKYLSEVPAAVRFFSYEPALGPLYLNEVADGGFPKIDWVIAGGESGPGARPSHPDWFRQVRDDCHAAGVPFFFKQWGEWREWEPGFDVEKTIHLSAKDGSYGDDPGLVWRRGKSESDSTTRPVSRIGKKAAGDYLYRKQYHQFPEVG